MANYPMNGGVYGHGLRGVNGRGLHKDELIVEARYLHSSIRAGYQTLCNISLLLHYTYQLLG
jgi:hypothetical protein